MKNTSTFIFKIIIPIIGFYFLITSTVSAQLPGWNYSLPIAITENSGTTLTNYQVKIIFDSQTMITNGQMNIDGSDIRFGNYCDSADLNNYWIESGINTNNTIIWVKVDTIEANQTKHIYMFHGNPAATTPLTSIDSTFFGPHSATDSVSGGAAGGVTTSQRGIRFGANQDILVTHFGKNEPNGSTRYITLFDNATQAIIMQHQVSGPAGQYNYSQLATPVWLIGGTQYVLQIYQGASDGYYFGPSTSQIGQHLTYYDMRYCNGCTQNTFPTNYLNNIHYGYPDFWYYTRNLASTEPTLVIGSPFDINLGSDDTYCGPHLLDAGNPGSDYTWNTGDSSQTLNASITGQYAVSIVNPYHCFAQDTINLVIHPLPTIELGNDTAYCGNALLYPGSFASYLWSTASTDSSILVATSDNYSVTVTDANGCTTSDNIYLDIYPLPLVELGSDAENCGSYILDAGPGMTAYLWSTGETSQLANITSSDLIHVTVTDLNGCSSDDSVNITIHPLPVINLGADTTLCTYQTLVLDAGAGYSSYNWNPTSETSSSILVDAGTLPITTTGYYVDVIDSNGCTGGDDIMLTVVVPPTVYAGSDQVLCSNSSIILDAGPGFFTYAWSNGDNSQTTLVNGALLGPGLYNFTVTVGDPFGCTDTDTVNINFADCIGIQGYEIIQVKIHPNPADEWAYLTIEADVQTQVVLTLTNSLGQVVYQESLPNIQAGEQVVGLNVTGYSPGLYFITLNSGDQKTILRLIVE